MMIWVQKQLEKLEVEDLQLIVAIDCEGNNIYDKRQEYAKNYKSYK